MYLLVNTAAVSFYWHFPFALFTGLLFRIEFLMQALPFYPLLPNLSLCCGSDLVSFVRLSLFIRKLMRALFDILVSRKSVICFEVSLHLIGIKIQI